MSSEYAGSTHDSQSHISWPLGFVAIMQGLGFRVLNDPMG